MVIHKRMHLFPLNQNKLDSASIGQERKCNLLSYIDFIPLDKSTSDVFGPWYPSHSFFKFGTLALLLCHAWEVEILRKTKHPVTWNPISMVSYTTISSKALPNIWALENYGFCSSPSLSSKNNNHVPPPYLRPRDSSIFSMTSGLNNSQGEPLCYQCP